MDYSFLNNTYSEENESNQFKISRHLDIPADFKLTLQQSMNTSYRIFDCGWVAVSLDDHSFLIWNIISDNYENSRHHIVLTTTSHVDLIHIVKLSKNVFRCVCLGNDGKVFVWHSSDDISDFSDTSSIITDSGCPFAALSLLDHEFYVAMSDLAQFVIFQVLHDKIIVHRGAKRKSLIGEIGHRVGSFIFGDDSLPSPISLSNVFMGPNHVHTFYCWTPQTIKLCEITRDFELRVFLGHIQFSRSLSITDLSCPSDSPNDDFERFSIISIAVLCGRLFALINVPPQELTGHKYQLILGTIELQSDRIVMTELMWQRSFNLTPFEVSLHAPSLEQEELFIRMDNTVVCVSAFGCVEVHVSNSPKLLAVGCYRSNKNGDSLVVLAERGTYSVTRNRLKLMNTCVFEGMGVLRDTRSRLMSCYLTLCKGNIRTCEDGISQLLTSDTPQHIVEAVSDCSTFIVVDRNTQNHEDFAALSDETSCDVVLARMENHRHFLNFLSSSKLILKVMCGPADSVIVKCVDKLISHNELVNCHYAVTLLKNSTPENDCSRGLSDQISQLSSEMRQILFENRLNLTILDNTRENDTERLVLMCKILTTLYESSRTANEQASQILDYKVDGQKFESVPFLVSSQIKGIVERIVTFVVQNGSLGGPELLMCGRAIMDYYTLFNQRGNDIGFDSLRSFLSLKIKEMVGVGESLTFAEDYCDFDTILKLCEDPEYEQRLVDNINRFSGQFDELAFDKLMKTGREKFCLFSGTFSEERLKYFLRNDGPYSLYSWAYYLHVAQPVMAMETLINSVRQSSPLMLKKRLCSMGKLLFYGFVDQQPYLKEHFDEIERELMIIGHNEVLSKAYGQVDTNVCLTPLQIINFYLKQESLTVEHYLLVCELYFLMEEEWNKRSLMLQIIIKAIRDDRWMDLPEYQFDDYCMNTKCATVLKAFVESGFPFDNLPSSTELLSQSLLAEYKNVPKCINGLEIIFSSFRVK